MRIILIDDDIFYFKALTKPLKEAGYELLYAKTGNEGLSSITSQNPDILIVDLKLPDISGFDILERLRRDPQFNHIPVVVITAEAQLSDKLKAFELGADDYLIKPFQAEELVARLKIIAQRGKAMKIVQQLEAQSDEITTTVAVHSLRGGTGSSSLAVNLALAFYQLWNKRTLLIDGVLTAGQVAIMLDAKPRVTWGNYANATLDDVDDEMVADLICEHASGISYVASPVFPIATDTFTNDFCKLVLEKFKKRSDFIVMDLAHDFSDMTIQMLNLADSILLVLGPDVSSLRAATSTVDTYDKLGFHPEKIKIVLNMNLNNSGIKQSQLEKALGRPIDFVIPYEPVEVIRALNFGAPFILENHDLPISVQLENIAYLLSNELQKNLPPPLPTPVWKRVTSRLGKNN